MIDLTEYLKDRCKKAGVSFDTYDLDFIMGCIFEWLDLHDRIITAEGVMAS